MRYLSSNVKVSLLLVRRMAVAVRRRVTSLWRDVRIGTWVRAWRLYFPVESE